MKLYLEILISVLWGISEETLLCAEISELNGLSSNRSVVMITIHFPLCI